MDLRAGRAGDSGRSSKDSCLDLARRRAAWRKVHLMALPRAVVLMGWVSFLADISSEMVYPLMPAFVVGVLGASTSTLGWIEGAAALVVATMTCWTGMLSDRLGKRVPFIRLGYGLPILGKALLAGATSWPMVMAGRAVDRLGKGVRSSPRDALIADVVAPSDRGRAFGFHRSMDTAGAILGVSISGFAVWWFTRSDVTTGVAAPPSTPEWLFRWLFGLAAIAGVGSLAVAFLIRDVAPRTMAATRVNLRFDLVRQLPAPYWRVVGLTCLFSLGNSSDAFLLLRARTVGLTDFEVIVGYAVFSLTYALASYPAGVLSDRLGRWRVVASGWTIYVLVYCGFMFTNAAGIWPLLATYGLYMALTEGVGKALVVDKAPVEMRGTALGVYYMSTGVSTLLASVLAGFAWDRHGPAATFGLGAGFALCAIVALIAMRRTINAPRRA